MPSAGGPYAVVAYAKGTIAGLLSAHSAADAQAISAKQHVEYFEEYFDHCQAKTVVVERNYIDHDYLEDFAGYYVRCFNGYSREATRLHFFAASFTEADFDALVLGAPRGVTADALQATYLGFIVVKPLPNTVVGRTCLTTYTDAPARRHFPSIRPYVANLFGIPLTVKTLAFQQQDSVAAACATSALWSVLQGTAMLFHHAVPSPVEITRAGGTHIPHAGLPDGRALPNRGLTPTQMAYAIRHVGLEPHIVGLKDSYALKDAYALQSTAYGYLRGKVPLILGVELGEFDAGNWKSCGMHAVAVTGYSLGHAAPKPWGPTGVLFTSSRVDKLYAHDDQIGPFARMPLAPTGQMQTQWRSPFGTGKRLVARSTFLLIPLYNKIRISNQRVEQVAIKLDSLIEALRHGGSLAIADRAEWDIHLTVINTVKEEWYQTLTDPKQRQRLLPLSLPKYLWRVVATVKGAQHVELLFDATDVDQGSLFVAGVDHVGAMGAAFQALAKTSPQPDWAVNHVLRAAHEF